MDTPTSADRGRGPAFTPLCAVSTPPTAGALTVWRALRARRRTFRACSMCNSGHVALLTSPVRYRWSIESSRPPLRRSQTLGSPHYRPTRPLLRFRERSRLHRGSTDMVLGAHFCSRLRNLHSSLLLQKRSPAQTECHYMSRRTDICVVLAILRVGLVASPQKAQTYAKDGESRRYGGVRSRLGQGCPQSRSTRRWIWSSARSPSGPEPICEKYRTASKAKRLARIQSSRTS